MSHPSLDLELMIKEVNVDLTTDVLNQLLVVQIAFIKVRRILQESDISDKLKSIFENIASLTIEKFHH